MRRLWFLQGLLVHWELTCALIVMAVLVCLWAWSEAQPRRQAWMAGYERGWHGYVSEGDARRHCLTGRVKWRDSGGAYFTKGQPEYGAGPGYYFCGVS